jgi:hypothetical protein
MSLATLKKKSNTLHGSFHTGVSGFSLQGGIRNPSYIGRTAHSQHNARTLMKGAEVRGSGGCCGTYREADLVRPVATLTTEDPTVLKTASKTANGMMAMRYRWVRRPYPYSIQKTYTVPMTARQKCATETSACDDATTFIYGKKPICGY